MKKIIFLLCCLPMLAQAQKTYSYITDRKFTDPTDLFGYNFRPCKGEIKDVKTQDINPGDVSFGVTQSNLYVEGEGIKGVYSVNNINSTDFGFKLLLMNARDPTVQGHLKIIVNKSGQVEYLVFKRSTKDKETIYYIKDIGENLAKQDLKYFTDRGELNIQHVDSIWGKKVKPFFLINSQSGIQTRLYGQDSCSIRFEEIVTIIDKTKKKDKDKLAGDVKKDSLAAKPIADVKKMPDAKKDIKIIKEHFMYVRAVLKYDDGTTEDKTTKYEVKSVVEKQDKTVGPDSDRYQWIISTNKGEIFMYLTAARTVNYIEVAEKSYLTRGF